MSLHSCNECRFKTTNTSHYLTHQNIHAIEKLGFKVYKCPTEKCYFIAESKTSLAIHKRIMGHSKRRYRCKFCDYSASTVAAMSLHNNRLHAPRQCPYCTVSVCSGWDLRQHLLRTHSDENKFKVYSCNKCQFKCCTNLDICHHIKTHTTSEKVYSCSEDSCLFITYKHDKLTQHLMTAHNQVSNSQFTPMPIVDTQKIVDRQQNDELPINVPIIRVVQTKPPETIYVDSDDSCGRQDNERATSSSKKNTRCIYCSTAITFRSHADLQQHLQKIHHMADLKSTIKCSFPRLYRCKHCKKKRFSSMKTLKAHTLKCDPRASNSSQQLKLYHKPRIRRYATSSETKSNETNTVDKSSAQNIFDRLRQMDIKLNKNICSSIDTCKTIVSDASCNDAKSVSSDAGELHLSYLDSSENGVKPVNGASIRQNPGPSEIPTTVTAELFRPEVVPAVTPEIITAVTPELVTGVTSPFDKAVTAQFVAAVTPELVTSVKPENVTTSTADIIAPDFNTNDTPELSPGTIPELVTSVTSDFNTIVTPKLEPNCTPNSPLSAFFQHNTTHFNQFNETIAPQHHPDQSGSPRFDLALSGLTSLPDMSLSQLEVLHQYYLYHSHILNLHNQQLMVASQYSSQVPSPGYIDHSVKTGFKCVVLGCGKDFQSLAYLLDHLKFCHHVHITSAMQMVCTNPRSLPKNYTCSLCEEICSTHDAFVGHFKQCHL